RSATNMPWKVTTVGRPTVYAVRAAVPTSERIVSQKVTWRSSSRSVRSTISSVKTSSANTISGAAGTMVEREKVAVFMSAQLALRNVAQQVLDGRIHHVGQLARHQAQPEHQDREHGEEGDFA